MIKFLPLLFATTVFAVETAFTVDAPENLTPSPMHVLLGSKKQLLRQGPKCRCNAEGQLLGHNCSSKYSCMAIEEVGLLPLKSKKSQCLLTLSDGIYAWDDCPKKK